MDRRSTQYDDLRVQRPSLGWHTVEYDTIPSHSGGYHWLTSDRGGRGERPVGGGEYVPWVDAKRCAHGSLERRELDDLYIWATGEIWDLESSCGCFRE